MEKGRDGGMRVRRAEACGSAQPGSEVELLADVGSDDLIVLLAVIAEHFL